MDRKYPERTNSAENAGDDIAGVVEQVGQDVYEFKPGDRVGSFHVMRTPHGSYAEYGIGEAHTTFHLPKELSYEEAATLPLAAMTAAVGLYPRLGLPVPWQPAAEEIPLVIYGGASAVGAYAIQFAKRSNIHPLIVVAGKGIPFVEKLIDPSKGDVVLDYRKGNETLVAGIKDALKGKTLRHAYDAISEHGSYQNICEVLDHDGGKITLVLPNEKYEEIPKTVNKSITWVGTVHEKEPDFGHVFFRLIARAVQEGWLKPHPYEVVAGGLGGVGGALRNLKEGKASAIKYVFRIADTQGVSQ